MELCCRWWQQNLEGYCAAKDGNGIVPPSTAWEFPSRWRRSVRAVADAAGFLLSITGVFAVVAMMRIFFYARYTCRNQCVFFKKDTLPDSTSSSASGERGDSSASFESGERGDSTSSLEWRGSSPSPSSWARWGTTPTPLSWGSGGTALEERGEDCNSRLDHLVSPLKKYKTKQNHSSNLTFKMQNFANCKFSITGAQPRRSYILTTRFVVKAMSKVFLHKTHF